MKRKSIKKIMILFVVLISLGTVTFSLVWNGVIKLNGYSASKYSIKGIDVSAYQGKIDWQELSNNDINFAFIKATEGSDFIDEKFAYNIEQAKKTSLNIGVYHFFSYDSEGKTQAQNFINNVNPFEGMLPPVIDLEFYGDKEKNPPDKAEVEKQLKIMLDMLEEHYGQKPIIYATEKSYELYLSGDYREHDIWIRNVVKKPKLSDERQWTFWQYTNREKLNGYKGEEKYIDVNVFNGSLEEYAAYLENNTYKINNEENTGKDINIPYPLELYLSSGAGAWYSGITINQDGSFTGEYHNTDMGSIGEDYPEGTMYKCKFEGKFINIQQINKHTFSLTLESITTEDEPGYTYIKGGIRHIMTAPCGLMNMDDTKPAKEFFLYTPDTKVNNLPEAFLFWSPLDYEKDSIETLSLYALYNKETEEGFFEYPNS